jgi:deazaflavin-dependent oxidoreductase (nitroreductase family)
MSQVPEGEREGVPSGAPPPRTEQPAPHPPKELHRGWLDRVGDTAFRGLARLGVGPASLLTTTGRRTGRPRRTPVIPVRQGGRLWLVAPYGEVSWVLNARATGQVDLRHGRHADSYTIREAPASEAGQVLKQYVEVASATRPYFLADSSAPVSAFVAEAHLHPVFELKVKDADDDPHC